MTATYIRIRDGASVTAAEALHNGVLRDGYRFLHSFKTVGDHMYFTDADGVQRSASPITDSRIFDALNKKAPTRDYRASITTSSQAAYEKRLTDAWRNPEPTKALRADDAAANSQQRYEDRIRNSWKG